MTILFNPEKLVLYLLLDVWLFAYVIAGLRKLRRADSGFLDRDGANRHWLRNLLIAMLAMLIFSTVLDFLALDRINLRFTPLAGRLNPSFVAAHQRAISTKFF